MSKKYIHWAIIVFAVLNIFAPFILGFSAFFDPASALPSGKEIYPELSILIQYYGIRQFLIGAFLLVGLFWKRLFIPALLLRAVAQLLDGSLTLAKNGMSNPRDVLIPLVEAVILFIAIWWLLKEEKKVDTSAKA